MKAHSCLILLLLVLVSSCKNTIHEQVFPQFHLVTQTKGPELGYHPQSGVRILYQDSYAFKDLNRNGRLDTYEDWRLTPEQRAHDLAQQISIEQIAGLMLYSPHVVVDDSLPSQQIVTCLLQDQMRHILVTKVKNAYTAALWHNNLQAIAEAQPFAIPTNNSSDPRNYTEADGEFNAGSGGDISQWPREIGLAATFDMDIIRRHAEIASIEYRALGSIRLKATGAIRRRMFSREARAMCLSVCSTRIIRLRTRAVSA